MDNKEVITNAWFQSRKCNFDETFHPIRAQVVQGSVITYSTEVVSVDADTDVEILSFDTYDYFPRLRGELSHVYFELSFQIKAGNASADIIYQLQARNRGDESWIDLSAAVTVSNIGTSYVTYLFKGYMDIKADINEIPFEMRIIAQSNESDTDLLVSFTCTWALQAPGGGSGSCRAVLQYGDNLYVSINDVIYYQTGTENYTACTGSMGQVRNFAVSNVSGASLIYAVTNTTMRVKGASTQVWANIGGSPDGAWSILHQGSNLFVGTNGGDVEVSTNGSSFATTSLTAGAAVKALAWFGGILYAGSANGKIWRRVAGVWGEVSTGLSGLGITEIYTLCTHNSKLYAAGLGADVAELNAAGTTWVTTGTLAGNANRVFALVSFLQDGEPAAVLFAATGNAADVDYWDGSSTWTNTGELSGDYQVLALAVYTVPGTIYAASSNLGRIWKANISATWESGELTSRLKNDIAGQETFIQAVGSVGGIGIPSNE